MTFNRSAASALATVIVVVGAAVALSIARLDPGGAASSNLVSDSQTDGEDNPSGLQDETPQGGQDPTAVTTPGGDPVVDPTKEDRKKAGPTGRCDPAANRASDVGVTKDKIKLAATIVDDGPGASFLGPVRIGMKAVVDKANRNGICGRSIDLILRNDSWDAGRGQQYIQNFVEGEKVFALAVVPSSEGLRAADSYIRKAKVPVVGTDGMLAHQYLNPWIWPVATPTISTMHLMAKDAYDRGARRFAIVFDAKYHFGVEGAYAYNQAVKRLTQSDIDGFDPGLKSCRKLFCGIQPNRPSYSSETNSFDNECYAQAGKICDFVAYLLEPDTARTFMSQETGRTGNPRYGMGGAQPLFNKAFAEACRTLCETMRVWTGYYPPIEEFAARPQVSQYVADVRQQSGTVDVANQFVQGGYVGMQLLVKALEQVGSDLTRENLKATLDSMTFDSGLASPMKWSPGSHFANTSAHAFLIVPGGWRSVTPMLKDPWPGQDVEKG